MLLSILPVKTLKILNSKDTKLVQVYIMYLYTIELTTYLSTAHALSLTSLIRLQFTNFLGVSDLWLLSGFLDSRFSFLYITGSWLQAMGLRKGMLFTRFRTILWSYSLYNKSSRDKVLNKLREENEKKVWKENCLKFCACIEWLGFLISWQCWLDVWYLLRSYLQYIFYCNLSLLSQHLSSDVRSGIH